ncbi:MAG TPA: hypothetical protein DD733_07115 [Clostridiales bacterium]|nr:hypothetical protein [Eubacteriales bacterium]HBR31839.1 hypothetical protein [Clostridiales bacterium]
MAKQRSEIDDSKIKITHTLPDGTVRDKIDGYIISYNDNTEIAYRLLAKWTNEKLSKKKLKQSQLQI